MLPPNAPSLVEVIRTLWQPWWVYVIAFAAVVILTPLLRRLAIHWQFYDRPEGLLKPHVRPIPYMGGVAIFAAWVLPVLIWAFAGSGEYLREIMAIVLGGAILLGLGLVDDLKEIRPRYKLIGQIAVAVGLYAAGVQFRAIPRITIQGTAFFTSGSPEFIAAGLFIQILLVTGASNAINLLDGLDGLCSGVIVVIAVGFLLVATHIGAWAVPGWCADMLGAAYRFNELTIVLALALTAAGLGFLLYNFNPATIFLGDAGSTFLGYLAAVFVILFADKAGMIKWFLAGLMIMGLPIFDTALALIRRIRNRRPIFGGDRSHFYDQLVDRGLSIRKTVVISYGLAVLGVVIAVGTLALRTRYMALLYVVILVAVAALATLGGFIRVDPSSAQTKPKSRSPSPAKPTKKLIIMGAGGLARELANAVVQINNTCPTFELLGYLDDNQTLRGRKLLNLPILGTVEQLGEYNKLTNLWAIAATGDGYIREKFACTAQSSNVPLATIIHPSSTIGADSSIQEGVFIAAGCVITVNVSLGQAVLVNMGCTIAHDVRLGKFASVHPGAHISGEVTIKDYALIGSQAVILNKCTIGQGAVVAMGAVVAHDVPDYTLVAGNPARIVKRLQKP